MKIKLTKIQTIPSKLSSDNFPNGTIIIGELDGVIEVDREVNVRDWTKQSFFGSYTKIGRVKEISSPTSFITNGSRWRWEKIEEPEIIIQKKEEPPPKLFVSGLIIKE